MVEGSLTSVGRPGYCDSPVIVVKSDDVRQPTLHITSASIHISQCVDRLWDSHLLPPCPALFGHVTILSTYDMSIPIYSLLQPVLIPIEE